MCLSTFTRIIYIITFVISSSQLGTLRAHALEQDEAKVKPHNDNDNDKTATYLRRSSSRQATSNDVPNFVATRNFKISLIHMGTDKSYNYIFRKAARKWDSIIVSDLPDVHRRSSSSHSWFGSNFDQKVNVDIDDVLIGYQMDKIDGPGGVLGYAGPVYRRRGQDSMTAISGIMKFDKEDFEWMSNADIELVIIHEMGHVLGIGSFWNDLCGVGCASGNTSYTCKKAKAEYKALGYSDDLKLQSNVCGHWDEGNFGGSRDEIMTPYFDQGKYQPISRITAAALSDLGYTIDMQSSDPWTRRNDSRHLDSTALSDIDNDDNVVVPTRSFMINETLIMKPVMIVLDENGR